MCHSCQTVISELNRPDEEKDEVVLNFLRTEMGNVFENAGTKYWDEDQGVMLQPIRCKRCGKVSLLEL